MNALTQEVDAGSLVPSADLKDSNAWLDDWHALNALYEEQGYLLLRNVLNPVSVNTALRRMMRIMARYGIVNPDDPEPIWTGVPLQGRHEESGEFGGICQELVSDPANLAIFEKILGEPVAYVPIVQYRSYPPNTPLLKVHQDGYYSPGIVGFRPIWIPLCDIGRTMGGLILAPGLHKQGPLHNSAAPPAYPIPENAIPADAWATTTFHAGDVLVIHPWTPHVGGRNSSNRVRFSIDTRIQSARNPCVMLGDITGITPDSVELRLADQSMITLTINEQTFVRTDKSPGIRIPYEEVADRVPIGIRVVASFEKGAALMLRRASEA